MDGFAPAVDGYVDVADQLSSYLHSRAEAQFPAERTFDNRSEFEARRENVRETFLERIGGLPDRMAEPSVETTGRVDADGYTVAHVVFESRPGFHVTANCYVPDGDGPFPGVLFLCGHVDAGKADPKNQQACAELAANGFVVLAVDPVCQGERRQYVDDGEQVFGGSGGTFPHCYAGQRCFYAGSTLARYMIHDDRCALDYLVGRADVDADRIGVTGTSGGGLQTLFLSLLDDRIDAIAPCCCVTTHREKWKTGKRIDGEQLLYGAIPDGIGYDDLLTALAPGPVCLGAAAWDEYFPIEGVHEAVERARQIYALYDAEDDLELTVAETTHCSVYEIGADVFAFLCDHLAADGYEPQNHTPIDESDLHCTPEGSVLAAYDEERTVEDLIQAHVEQQYPDARSLDAAADSLDADDVDPDALRRRLVERFDLDREGCALHPRFVDRTTEDGLDVSRVWFRTERDPDIVVTGVLVRDPESTADAPAVVLYGEGTEELPERTEAVRSLAREHGAALVFDPRGVGAVRNRVIPVPAWADEYDGVAGTDLYDGIYGTEFKLAYDALQLGTSLLGMRTYDVLRAAAFLRSETGADRVSFVGAGSGAYHALYAAAAAEHVAQVDLDGLDDSFADLATEPDVPFRPRLTVFDVLGMDVPRLAAALERRGVRVAGVS